MKRIILTGGGTAGHVTPNIALIPELKKRGYDGFYSLEPHLGSFEGLSDLELDDAMEKLPKGGEGTFTLAYQSFIKILEEAKKWKR